MNDDWSPDTPYVLVVEDHDDTRETLGMLLKFWGYRIRAVRCGAEALDHATNVCPSVVLLDVAMPRMDGWELARRLRRLPGMAEVLMIAISGYDREEHRRHSLEAGCDLHLVKPVDPMVLQQLLSRVEVLSNVARPVN